MNIDLHIHSSISDGSCTPDEILTIAKGLKLRAFSITDHDTLDGNREILSGVNDSSIHFITGVEISSFLPEPFKSSGSFHILGYGFSIHDIPLNQALKTFQTARNERNPRIIAKLNQLGIDISMAEVQAFAGPGIVGRPHIAGILVKKGVVSSIKEAFNTYLAKNKPAFVDKYRIDCKSAITLIKNAGGAAVLAHPSSLGMAPDEMETLLKELSKNGLTGIEAYYSTHSPEETQYFIDLANRLGLLVTGGSDFHGSLKDDITIGSGRGKLCVPHNLYDALINEINTINSERQDD